jgi:RimJ/RimL family protein N-acetyltransferase
VLVTWLAGKIGTTPDGLVGDTPFNIMGVLRADGALMGAVMFNHWRGGRIEIAGAGEPGWISRADMRAVFAYPFEQLHCWTILSYVNRHNTVSRDFTKRLGFVERCVIPCGPTKARDMVLYSMTRPECRWLPPVRLH